MMDQPPPQPPLPPFVLSNPSQFSLIGDARWDRPFSFVWGDLKLASEKAHYVLKDKTLEATGSVLAKLGTERIEGKNLKITGLDLVKKSLDKEGFSFFFSDAKLFAPVIYLSGEELSFSSETGADVELVHCVGDGDDPPNAVHKRAVNMAKRSQEVAVVVVSRRHEWDSQDVRCDRAVDVGVNHVRVEEIRCLRPDRAHDVYCEPR